MGGIVNRSHSTLIADNFYKSIWVQDWSDRQTRSGRSRRKIDKNKTMIRVVSVLLSFVTPCICQQADSWGSLSAGISSNEISGHSLTPAAGFNCRVCEDVANTWRNTFQCVGMGEDMSPRITQDGPGCLPAGSNCTSVVLF